jgi:hypothetical protein
MRKLQDHPPARVALTDKRMLTVNLTPLGGIRQLDDNPTA